MVTQKSHLRAGSGPGVPSTAVRPFAIVRKPEPTDCVLDRSHNFWTRDAMAVATGTDNPDTLFGTEGDDTIFGYAGNDAIDGGAGK